MSSYNIFINNSFKLVKDKWNQIPLLDKWLLGEILTPLLFAIAAFTVVSLSVGVMFELVRKIVESGLPLLVAIKVLLLRLPSFLVISFPMAVLMSTLLAYSKLSSNSELKALRSVGISTSRIIAPAIILSIFMTFMTFLFNDIIVPRSNLSSEITLKSALGKAISTEKGDDIIYSRFGSIKSSNSDEIIKGMTQIFYAKEFRDGIMNNITIIDFSSLNDTQMLVAKTGVWNKAVGKWKFRDGKLLTLYEDGSVTSVVFDDYLYSLDRDPAKLATLPKDSNDMTISEAVKAQQLYERAGNIKQSRKMKVRIQEKYTLPMACIVFGLIGSSLGAKPVSRTSRSQGFGISVILILLYYILSFSFSSLGVTGALSPLIAAWSPVFISLIAGTILLRQASQ